LRIRQVLIKAWFDATWVLSGYVTSVTKLARLQGMGVLVAVNTGVAVGAGVPVGTGVLVKKGVSVSVVSFEVGEANVETWVNSAATVSAA
jgi:hypothetical protein